MAEYRRGLILYFCCVLMLPLFGIAAALLARAALKRENGLVIDEHGVLDQLSFNGRIDWPNITGVQRLNPLSETSAFVLRLKDRRSYFRHGWTKPFVGRGKDEVFIYGLGLSSAAEILAAIESGIRAAALKGNEA